MRLLFVTGLTERAFSGAQRETEQLIHAMVDREHEVGLASDRLTGPAEAVEHFPMPYPPRARSFRERLSAIVPRFQPDVVHVLGGGLRVLQAVHAAVGHTRPWITTIHSIPPYERTGRWGHSHNALYYRTRNLASLPSAMLWRAHLGTASFTRAICHSPFVVNAAQHAGCPRQKLVEIPLGYDPAMERTNGEQTPTAQADDPCLFEPSDEPRLLSVGGLLHHKGFHDYLRVVAKLVRDHPRLRYVIMGDPRDARYRHALQRMIDRLRLHDHVRLVPKATEAQRLATAARADLYIVPSHEEGFCLSYLEGAMLTPRALGTRCGVIDQIAQDDPAQEVVAPMNPHALEQATRRLLALPVSPDQLAQRRAALRERFTWHVHAEAHADLYHELAGVPVPMPV
ncbi:MAG: glycosyltransferase family 4 protein [Phycisphaeraceae bacterium]